MTDWSVALALVGVWWIVPAPHALFAALGCLLMAWAGFDYGVLIILILALVAVLIRSVSSGANAIG